MHIGSSQRVQSWSLPARMRKDRKAVHDCGGNCDGPCCNSSHDSQPVMKFYTVSDLGDKQSLTPEGFLLCLDVPIARTGEQLYASYEVTDIAPVNDIVRIMREEQEVFRPETMASFAGKPVTNDHPEVDVTPDNWGQIAKGVVQNVRRGVGTESNLLLADLLITDKEAIEAVRDGKREVSCGYDAKFEQLEPGRGRQINIIGNHVALVDSGRCGPRCAIKDGERKMTKANWKDRVKAAFLTRDEKAIDAALKDAEAEEAEGMHVHLHTGKETADADPMESRFKKLEDWMGARDSEREEEKKAKDKALDEEEEEEKKKKETQDEALTEEEEEEEEKGKKKDKAKDASSLYAEVVSRAEILAPGVTLPRLSANAVRDSKKTQDGLCIVKRAALNAAMKNEPGKKALAPFMDGKTIDSLSCSMVDAAFIGASEIMKAANNGRVSHSFSDSATKKMTDEAIEIALHGTSTNAKNRDFWKNNK